ncbi:MAG TPA: IS110 family transposase [Tissierellaceae bacterium]
MGIPEVGVVTVAGILGEIGDPSQFEGWKQIKKYAGLNLIEDSSGERKGKIRISKRGRAMLRNLLYQIAIVMVCKNKEMKVLYTYFKTRRENPLEKK